MHRVILACAAVLLAAARTSGPAAASHHVAAARRAGVDIKSSVSQGFNFQKDSRESIGHINYLKVGDTEMSSDLNVTDPMNIANYVKVFGVASGISWNGGYAEPVSFSAQVSVDNKNKLATLQHKSMANTEVTIQFTFYAFDPVTKKYYQSFHTNAIKLGGLVLKRGGELAMNIAMNQSSEVVIPKNHTFTLGVMPQDQSMQLYLATSPTAKVAKPWGVAVGAQ